MQTHNPVTFRCAATKSACEISAVEICAPRKSGPKFTKIGDDLLRKMPLIMPNFIALGQTIREKRYNFFTPFSILVNAEGLPVPKLTNLGDYTYSKAPFIMRPHFVSALWKPLYIVDFVDGMTDRERERERETVNDIISALPCGAATKSWIWKLKFPRNMWTPMTCMSGLHRVRDRGR